ncbi:MAG: class I SAM-dependent methyltransferase [Chitinophagaceae bacterium]|nr:class I SAM-dependent methyltransferase [Anaerolineae bacterium]
MMQESVNFDRAADYYDATRGFPAREEVNIAQFIYEAGELSKENKVLEVGIGTGRIALPLARKVRQIFGADLSTEMMGRLRQKQTDEAIYLTQADATRLPISENTFDAVVVVHVFHLVSDVNAVLSELARVLRPGGKLIHCWNRDDDARWFKVRESWKSAVINRRRGSLEWDNFDALIQKAGWLPVGNTQKYNFVTTRVPTTILEGFQNRIWSATWDISDDDLAQGSAAIQEALVTTYDEPTVPLEVREAFNLQVYTPS